MKEFYYAADGSSINLYLEGVPVLVSAATLYKNGKFSIPKTLINAEKIWLDSGGFSFFTKWSRYPFSTKKYAEFAQLFCEQYPQTEFVSIMDYPCEDYVNRNELYSNYDRIEETIKNTKDLLPVEITANWVSVVQGGCLSEYQFCCDKLIDNGLITKERVAIGSICTKKVIDKALLVCLIIKRQLKTDLHAFGLDYRFLCNRHIWYTLTSSDSAAWKFTSSNKKSRDNYGMWRPRSLEEKKTNFDIYQNKINNLFKIRERLTTL